MRPKTQWLWQAFSGLLLVFLLALHLTVNHFAAGGLLTYEDIVAYLAQPWVRVLETLFLLTVTYHALAGVRGILPDLNLTTAAARRLTLGLTVLGVLICAYGLWLFTTL